MKNLTLAAAALAALAIAVPAIAQDKPQEKPKETTIVIKDDTTPKVKKGAKAKKPTKAKAPPAKALTAKAKPKKSRR